MGLPAYLALRSLDTANCAFAPAHFFAPARSTARSTSCVTARG